MIWIKKTTKKIIVRYFLRGIMILFHKAVPFQFESYEDQKMQVFMHRFTGL